MSKLASVDLFKAVRQLTHWLRILSKKELFMSTPHKDSFPDHLKEMWLCLKGVFFKGSAIGPDHPPNGCTLQGIVNHEVKSKSQ